LAGNVGKNVRTPRRYHLNYEKRGENPKANFGGVPILEPGGCSLGENILIRGSEQ